ncbi:MAG: hypothetical protein FVQ80_05070 [Planctomycetes bacterium]|nr:hypothetical protein [Planctomycetota bacterium]
MLKIAMITTRQTTRIAARVIFISCVVGLTYRHTNDQQMAISDIRKTKLAKSSNMTPQYPILTQKSRKKHPILPFVRFVKIGKQVYVGILEVKFKEK